MKLQATLAVPTLFLALCAGQASGQTLPLANASFEESNIFSPAEPLGWHNLSSPSRALHRQVGDGQFPTAVARTGEWCVELRSDANGGFLGFTTDTVNFFDPEFDFYDPTFDWYEGDAVASGYYYIPSSSPVQGDVAGLKMNPKLNNQDYGGYEELTIDENSPQDQWVYFELRYNIFSLRARALELAQPGACGRPNGCFDSPLPPNFPERLKLTISRFAPDGTVTSGSIFWDDMSFRQYCSVDFNVDGFVDDADFVVFANAYESFVCPDGTVEGVGCPGDVNLDGFVDDSDFVTFAQRYEEFTCVRE